VITVAGAEHDLPQENAPGFFDAVAGFVTGSIAGG